MFCAHIRALFSAISKIQTAIEHIYNIFSFGIQLVFVKLLPFFLQVTIQSLLLIISGHFVLFGRIILI